MYADKWIERPSRLCYQEALEMEWQFNKEAGFSDADDEMPEFFFSEALEPTGKIQRHTQEIVNKHLRTLINA